MLFAADTALWQQLLGIAVIILAAWAVLREWEVRFVLVVAALLLGLLAWNPQVVVREFLITMTNERFVLPLCTAMGFAHVLKHTGCDQHLVHLLAKPLTQVRFLLVPGTVVVGFLVNMPIVSQTSTAATIGAVIIPILRAARLSPVTIGAALLLGSSIGGELLNPGAPELQTIVTGSQDAARKLSEERKEQGEPDAGLDPALFTQERCVQRILPLDLLGLIVSTLVFWYLSHRYEFQHPAPEPPKQVVDIFRVDWFKAAVPILPLVFMYLTAYPFRVLEIDLAWIQDPAVDAPLNEARLIGLAMLLGVVAAALVTPTKMNGVLAAFFEGGGYGYAHIVSLIAVARCFGEGINAIGIAAIIGSIIEAWPAVLMPLAGILPLTFAALCGSGMATAQSLFGFFARPALELGIDPTHVGAVVSIAAAAGRTLSPVAAVTMMCARMTGTTPLQLSKQLAVPVLISLAIVIAVAMIMVPAL